MAMWIKAKIEKLVIGKLNCYSFDTTLLGHWFCGKSGEELKLLVQQLMCQWQVCAESLSLNRCYCIRKYKHIRNMSRNQQILLEMQFQLGTPFLLFDSVMKGSQLKMLPF